jgi:anti-sigma factor RsiW
MNCNDTRHLIHCFVDLELDLVRNSAVEQHLHDCPACAEAHDNLLALRASLRTGPLYFKPTASLKQRIQASLRNAGGNKPRIRTAPWRSMAIAASVAAAVMLTWGLVHFASIHSDAARLAKAAVSSHVRSLVATTPIDLPSSKGSVLKSWVKDELGFSPDVADPETRPGLADQGFRLEGARVDYLDNQRVAALVYKREQHLINCFVWPSAHASEGGVNSASRQGYHLYYWTESGMNYWVVSDLPAEDLQQFVQLIRD